MQASTEPSRTASEVQAFAPISGTRASELVVEQIREAFFRGMKPGDWLGTETELSQRFGVSRLTMRDAVRTLEAYGMVDVKVGAGGGLRIAQSNPTHFVEALAVQIHLLGLGADELAEAIQIMEPQAARLAAVRRTEEQLERLRETLQRHRDANDDPDEFHDAAADFHAVVAECAGNQPLYVALRAVRINESHLLEPRALRVQAANVLGQHRALFDAIEAQDAPKAERLMVSHVENLLKNPLFRPQGADRN